MNTVKVLWLSRHPLSKVQEDTLWEAILSSYDHKYAPPKPTSMEIVVMNATYPKYSMDAVDMLEKLTEEHGAYILSGVFPAHIAGRLAKSTRKFLTLVPVSVPVPAEHGETRGFEHSHWEFI